MTSVIDVKVKRVSERATFIRRGSPIAAAYDVAYSGEAPITLLPGESFKCPTGWAFELPPGVSLLILPRSGLSTKRRLRPMNTPGLLDADYRGELFVAMENFGLRKSDGAQIIKTGDFIAQLLFVPYFDVDFKVVESLSKTERGSGGFGSTG